MKEKGFLTYSPLCPDCLNARCIGCRKNVVRLFKNRHHKRMSEIFDLDDNIVMIDVTLKDGHRILVRECEVFE